MACCTFPGAPLKAAMVHWSPIATAFASSGGSGVLGDRGRPVAGVKPKAPNTPRRPNRRSWVRTSSLVARQRVVEWSSDIGLMPRNTKVARLLTGVR